MKKQKFLLLLMPFIINSCTKNIGAMPTSTATQKLSDTGGQQVPANAPPAPASNLGNLKAGVISDPSFTEEEKKLAGILDRKVNPEFPLKIGVILYSNPGILSDKDRKKFYDNFLQKLKENNNNKQVIEISPNLISGGNSVDELRKLGAKFQVSTLLVVSDSYQFPQENKDAYITPVDIITGLKTWESLTNLDVYALDVLNGVFAFSSSSSMRVSDKYNRSDSYNNYNYNRYQPASNFNNKDNAIVKESADKAWTEIQTKVNKEINDYKQRSLEKSAVQATPQT